MAASLSTSPVVAGGHRSPRLDVIPGAAPPAAAHRPQPLEPLPLRLLAQPEGMLQVYTAPFRGSVGSVLSQALRSAGLGSRVLISQLLKGGVEQGLSASPWLCGRLQWLRPAVPVCLAEPAATHPSAVAEAVRDVWAYSRNLLMQGEVDLMVLDELGLAIDLGYVDSDDVLEALNCRPPHLDVILTGPVMGPELMALADQVTQLRRGL